MKKLFSLLALLVFLSSLALTSAFAGEPCNCAGTGKNCMEQPCAMKECPNCAEMKKDGEKNDKMNKECVINDDMNKDDMKKKQ